MRSRCSAAWRRRCTCADRHGRRQLTIRRSLTLMQLWPAVHTLPGRQPHVAVPVQDAGISAQNDTGVFAHGRTGDAQPVPPSTVHGMEAWQQFEFGTHVIGTHTGSVRTQSGTTQTCVLAQLLPPPGGAQPFAAPPEPPAPPAPPARPPPPFPAAPPVPVPAAPPKPAAPPAPPPLPPLPAAPLPAAPLPATPLPAAPSPAAPLPAAPAVPPSSAERPAAPASREAFPSLQAPVPTIVSDATSVASAPQRAEADILVIVFSPANAPTRGNSRPCRCSRQA